MYVCGEIISKERRKSRNVLLLLVGRHVRVDHSIDGDVVFVIFLGGDLHSEKRTKVEIPFANFLGERPLSISSSMIHGLFII